MGYQLRKENKHKRAHGEMSVVEHQGNVKDVLSDNAMENHMDEST